MSLQEANEKLEKILEWTTDETTVTETTETDVVTPTLEVWVAVEETTTAITAEEAQSIIDEENKEIAEGKTLAEHIYDKDEEKLKEKVDEDIAKHMQDVSMPDIDKSELNIEEVVEDVAKIVNKDQTPEKVIEQITEMFIEKEEQMQVTITRLEKKNQALEKIVDELSEKNNKLKYSDTKMDIVDDFHWHYTTVYKAYKETPTDEKVLKNLWYISMLWVQKAYPILEVDDIINLVREKKDAKMNAIKWISQWGEKDNSKPKNIVQETKRLVPWIIIS